MLKGNSVEKKWFSRLKEVYNKNYPTLTFNELHRKCLMRDKFWLLLKFYKGGWGTGPTHGNFWLWLNSHKGDQARLSTGGSMSVRAWSSKKIKSRAHGQATCESCIFSRTSHLQHSTCVMLAFISSLASGQIRTRSWPPHSVSVRTHLGFKLVNTKETTLYFFALMHIEIFGAISHP